MTTTDMPKTVHLGKNVKRIREILGIKQEGLANKLGLDWNQQRVSSLEDRTTIEPALLEQVAEALKVPVDAIKNFNEDATINIISNTFHDFHDNASGINNHCELTFNPLNKYIEAMEENKKLYEALLKEKDEKNALLQKFLDEKK